MSLSLRHELQLDVTLNNAAVDAYEVSTRVFLTKKRGESLAHVLMKFLGYVLFYHPELRIEASAGQHYKPDLVRLDAQAQPVQWLDCGTTGTRKLARIARKNKRTLIHIIKKHEAELVSYKRSAEPRLDDPARVRYLTFRDHFLRDLGELVGGRHKVEATVTGPAGSHRPDHVWLSVDGVGVDTPIIWV